MFEHDDPAFYIDGEWWEHHVEVRLLVPDAGACQTRMPDSKVSASIPSFINPTFDVIVLCEDLIAEWVRMGSGTHASRDDLLVTSKRKMFRPTHRPNNWAFQFQRVGFYNEVQTVSSSLAPTRFQPAQGFLVRAKAAT
ncbi:hypothetical protein LLH04_31100 (plasmid) [Pseudomonas aeruginosa]|uniref:hypothetical protein n=1 Tax=Pseudomonas aeruginosa TaxID=287 RepID=UPI001D188807|nr:hypothetical protein [Pseudomonas aeruginosa]UEG09200.1 hypothetical protein LLH04_31100 [Pseudomonas aeruginosa]